MPDSDHVIIELIHVTMQIKVTETYTCVLDSAIIPDYTAAYTSKS